MLRGEIWLINLDPTIGAEIKKIRPAVIVNDDAVGILVKFRWLGRVMMQTKREAVSNAKDQTDPRPVSILFHEF